MKKVGLISLFLLVSVNVYGARGYWEDNSSLPATWTNGYVGIGREYPNYLLDVNGTTRTKYFKMTNGAVKDRVLICAGSDGTAEWKELESGGGSSLWNEGYGGVYYNEGSVGIFNLGNDNDVSILAVSENTSTLDEFAFKGDFAGTGETGNALKLESHWADNVMTWRGDGNVGIGTSQPSKLLDLRKDVMHQIELDRTENSAISNLFYIGPSAGGDVDHLGIHTNGLGGNNMVVFKSNGRVGIGTATPFGPLAVKTDSNHNLVVENFSTGVRIAVSQDDGEGNEELILSGGLGEDHVTIHRSGNVGIGITDPGSYKLAVNGHIRTKEITVESDWSDFVFEDDYQLMSLEKLKEHIKKEKSLPGIPTEKEVKENGVEVGEMQAKLLEKVEELTLYVIELKKENNELEKANKELEKRISALED